MNVPGPAPASVEVGAAAISDAVGLGVADAGPVTAAEADAVLLAAGVALAGGGEVVAPAAGVVVVVGAVAFGAEVDLGFDVVGFGFDVVAVGAGALVVVGSGGATRGFWPEPKRNPTTVPGAGS